MLKGKVSHLVLFFVFGAWCLGPVAIHAQYNTIEKSREQLLGSAEDEVGQFTIRLITERLCHDRSKVFFPNLCQITQVYDSNLFLSFPLLRIALENDIALLPERLIEGRYRRSFSYTPGEAPPSFQSLETQELYRLHVEMKGALAKANIALLEARRKDSLDPTPDVARLIRAKYKIRLLIKLGEFLSVEERSIPAESRIKSLLPLLIEISHSKSDADVNSILRFSSSATGGWRLKRASSFLVSFGALVGGMAGRERLFAKDELNRLPAGFKRTVFGSFIPIGIDLSWSILEHSTFGVFISTFDLGNIGNLGITDGGKGNIESIDREPNNDLEKILSPGIYFRWGLGSTPFVFGFGYSFTPGLRKANLVDGTTIDLDAERTVVFLAVDIVLAPIF